MESRDVDLAYCAGLFDGEGCISATQNKKDPKWHCEIFLGMVDRRPLDFFQRTVGIGSINRRSDLWMYQAATAKAVHAIRQIAPYLQAKKEQAHLFLEYAKTFSKHTPRPLPAETHEKRRLLSDELAKLRKCQTSAYNKNGVNSVKPRPGNTEPSEQQEQVLEGVETTGLPARAPRSQEKI